MFYNGFTDTFWLTDNSRNSVYGEMQDNNFRLVFFSRISSKSFEIIYCDEIRILNISLILKFYIVTRMNALILKRLEIWLRYANIPNCTEITWTIEHCTKDRYKYQKRKAQESSKQNKTRVFLQIIDRNNEDFLSHF